RPAVQQFVYLATSPGVEAAEIAEAGNEQAAFTQALLQGLRKGSGRAKGWDAAAGRYVVTAERLLPYLIAAVSSQTSAVTNWHYVQVPRRAGEYGSLQVSNPVLAQFAEGAFGRETLRVMVAPPGVAGQTRITVLRDGQPASNTRLGEPQPVEFSLAPREY